MKDARADVCSGGTCPLCRADRERETERSVKVVAMEAEQDELARYARLAGRTRTVQAQVFDSPIMEAHGLVHGARRDAYGTPVENFGRTAELWRAQFGWDVDARRVALALLLVKVARLAQTPDHRDTVVDIAGYAEAYGLAG